MTTTRIDPRRIEDAQERWLKGESPREIQRALADAYGVQSRQARRYLRIARERLAAEVKTVNPEAIVARAEGMLLEAYKAAQVRNASTGQPNANAMVVAAQRIAELHGVMAPQKVKLDATITGLGDLLAKAFEEPATTGEKPTA
jgi:hypothetical protein